jgi:hypothetical protein
VESTAIRLAGRVLVGAIRWALSANAVEDVAAEEPSLAEAE